MKQTFTRLLSQFFCFFLFAVSTEAFAQNISIGTIDPGPYSAGSGIVAPIKTNIATACFQQDNKFELYLSDAAGNFPGVKIGEYNSFYTTFVNGTIPAGTVPGSSYKLQVRSTKPTTSSVASSSFTISASGIIQVKLQSTAINAANPEVFGYCEGKNNKFVFTNESSTGSTVSATFTNEVDQSVSQIDFSSSNQEFNAKIAHYTIVAKAVNNGIISTKGYFLINSPTLTSFTTTAGNTICLPEAILSYTVNTAILKQNFPGNTYFIDWGDGTSKTYSICDIINNGDVISHKYSNSSCGKGGFKIVISTRSPFCGQIGAPINTVANVLKQPKNNFLGADIACTNSPVTFLNVSDPGQVSNSPLTNCEDPNVKYSWYVDGLLVIANQAKDFKFTYSFPIKGEHTVRLESAGTSACQAENFEKKIYVSDPPTADFTFNGQDSLIACLPLTFKPNNISAVDETFNQAAYAWKITGPAAADIKYINGTTANSREPEYVIATPGIYKLQLSVTTKSCDVVTSAEKTIVVNAEPTVTLSPGKELCGKGQLLSFDNKANSSTKVMLGGTVQELPDTYTWTITGGNFEFKNGTTTNSKYPTILFTDYGTYTVSITHKNNCGSVTTSQVLGFKESPTVNAGVDQTICPDATVALDGNITGPTPKSFEWIGGAGTFSPGRNVLKPVYTPTSAEVSAGLINLVLKASTTNPAPCTEVIDEIIITINPPNKITSASSKAICTATAVNYQPLASITGSNFNWTATGTSNASGFSVSGTGEIKDLLTNSDVTTNATVTYTITPEVHGCQGTPFAFTVIVTPNPTVTAQSANPLICSASPAGIALSSNLAGTRFTWTSIANGQITGNTNLAVPTFGNEIKDVLVNKGNTPATVTYEVTPYSANNCPGAPTSITITVQPQPEQANAGPDEEICDTDTYLLKANKPAFGSGKWTLVSGQGGVSFTNDTDQGSSVKGLQANQVYTFRWAITSAPGCPPTSDEVTIKLNALSVGGTTAGSTTVCAEGNSGKITLSGQNGKVIRWESSIDGGSTWQAIGNATATYNYAALERTTQFRAVIQSGVCNTAFSTAATITVNPRPLQANAGADVSLCNETNYVLQGNDPVAFTGKWTLTSGQTGITFTDATRYNTRVNGLKGGQTYIFRWSITAATSCPSSVDDVVVKNQDVISNAINAAIVQITEGQTITITGNQPTGGTNIYTYSWEGSTDNISWTAISGQTGKDMSLVVNKTTHFRRIVTAGACTQVGNSIKITALPRIASNTIASDQNVCVGTAPGILSGSTPTGGDGRYKYQWQKSENNGSTWTNIAGAASISYQPASLLLTSSFRRVVSSIDCSCVLKDFSNVVKVVVNLPAKAEYNFTQNKGCAPFLINATSIKAVPYPAINNIYNWYAGTKLIGTGINFPGFTIENDAEAVVIKLIVTSKSGCGDAEISHTFSTSKNVIAKFTQDKTTGCSPLVVKFTNPLNETASGTTYSWNFGNGTTSGKAQPDAVTYQAQANGRDSIYTVTLTATNSCGVKTFSSTVLVRPKIKAIFSPDKTIGCSPLAVNFENTSPGSNNKYTFDFGDGETLVATDNRAVQHTYTNTIQKTYTVTMIAENECGQEVSQYKITVSPNTIVPRMIVNSDEKAGCAPWTVNFANNSTGANFFVYDFGDGNTLRTNQSPEKVRHTFTKGGVYQIKMTASNGCSETTTIETITVYPQPAAAFTADFTTGCNMLEVRFNNQTPAGRSYLWDFGDGQTSVEVNPVHQFDHTKSPYTIKLIVLGELGCSDTLTMQDYIRVAAPPKAAFVVNPDAIQLLPNYTFSFVDQSDGNMKSWQWDFGDGSTSSLQHPEHTYPDTGRYQVKMTVSSMEGCTDTISKYVQITGTPGYLFVPNAFMPGSVNSELITFKPKGSGLESWSISVFNKWGEMVWQSSKLDERGSPAEGWDGMIKGSTAPQGAYIWKISGRFINGTDWKGMTYDRSAPKRTGIIQLIR